MKTLELKERLKDKSGERDLQTDRVSVRLRSFGGEGVCVREVCGLHHSWKKNVGKKVSLFRKDFTDWKKFRYLEASNFKGLTGNCFCYFEVSTWKSFTDWKTFCYLEVSHWKGVTDGKNTSKKKFFIYSGNFNAKGFTIGKKSRKFVWIQNR